MVGVDITIIMQIGIGTGYRKWMYDIILIHAGRLLIIYMDC